MRRRRHVREVELRHLRDGIEDRRELCGEPPDLVVAQVEPRKPGDVEHLFTGDRHVGQSFQNGKGRRRRKTAPRTPPQAAVPSSSVKPLA